MVAERKSSSHYFVGTWDGNALNLIWKSFPMTLLLGALTNLKCSKQFKSSNPIPIMIGKDATSGRGLGIKAEKRSMRMVILTSLLHIMHQ